MEDGEDVARLVAHLLQTTGFQVNRPAKPGNLISDAEKTRPALFILDLMLPEGDGFQLCRSIKHHPNLHDIPVVILTARTGVEDRRRALNYGADAYITKPFKTSALIEAVRTLSKDDLPEKPAN